MTAPICCEDSKNYRTVKLFIPSSKEKGVFWTVPGRTAEDYASSELCHMARFCPFCGVDIGLRHIPFEEK